MQTKKLRYLLLFAVIAIAATVVWYFAYWVKTPQYSLGLIGTAVQKHDFSAFEKHVDMETLYSSAYDVLSGLVDQDRDGNTFDILY